MATRPPPFDPESIADWLQLDRRTRGMYARKWGKSLILGRKELDPDDEIVDDDRVKITRERARHYTIRVKDWKGRYHHTGIEDDLGAVLRHLKTSLLHAVQATPYNKKAEDRERTSGKRH